MGWFFASALSEEQAALLKRRCGSRVSALASCSAANAGNAAACATFATDVDLCRATVLCPAKADDFMRCASAAVASAAITTGKECDGAAAAMRRCLRGFAVSRS